MDCTTVGSIQSFCLKGNSISIMIKGISDYSNIIGGVEYLTLVKEDKTPYKQIPMDTQISVAPTIHYALALFLAEAHKSKTVFKFDIEVTEVTEATETTETVGNQGQKYKIIGVQTHDGNLKLA